MGLNGVLLQAFPMTSFAMEPVGGAQLQRGHPTGVLAWLRRLPFEQEVAVAAREKNVNRLLDPRWGNVGGELRLWDRSGREWTLARDELDRETTARLYADPHVPVAVAEGAGALDWVDAAERRRRWAELEPRTFDPAWEPPRDAPGSLPFDALQFRSGDDLLLLFLDND